MSWHWNFRWLLWMLTPMMVPLYQSGLEREHQKFFMFFMKILLKSISKQFEECLNLRLPDVSSWLGRGSKRGMPQRWDIFLLCPSRCMISALLILVMLNIITCLTWCLPDFSIVKLVYFFPFQTLFLRSEFLFPSTLKAGGLRPTLWRGGYQRICGSVLKPPQSVVHYLRKILWCYPAIIFLLKVLPTNFSIY